MFEIKDSSNLSNEEMAMQEMVDSIELLTISFNKNQPLSKRLDAIDKIRNIAWRTAYKMETKILNILKKTKEELDYDDMGYIYICISLVLMELDMRDEEVKLLDEMYE